MKCPCCDKDLTPEVIENLRAEVARQQADPPPSGTVEAGLLFSKVALLEQIDRATPKGFERLMAEIEESRAAVREISERYNAQPLDVDAEVQAMIERWEKEEPRALMTPEAEALLDEAAARIYGSREALEHYLAAFFNDVCVEKGHTRGEVTFDFMTRELVFETHLADGRRFAGRVDRDAVRYLLADVEKRFPQDVLTKKKMDAAISASLVHGAKWEAQPQWQIEKEAARELARRMTPPSLMQIQKDDERRRAEDVPVFHRPKGRWEL